MTMHVEWYIPNRVIEETLSGKLTVEDLQEHTEKMLLMLQEADTHAPGTSVLLLLDITRAETMPPTYLMLQYAMPVLRMKNRGLMIMITTNKTFRSIIELTAHVMRFQMRSVATREEALRVLEQAMYTDHVHKIG